MLHYKPLSNLRISILIILILLTPIIIYAQNNIPGSITEKSNQFLLSKVGEDFFNKYIRIDYDLSTYSPPSEFCVQNPNECPEVELILHYRIVYSFKIPEKPYVNELFEILLDTNGNIIEEDLTTAEIKTMLPDCINNPNECNFIDETEAIRIAKDAAFEEGLTDWETSFEFGTIISDDEKLEPINKYIWKIENILSKPNFLESTGKEITIDAKSGEVISIYDWQSFAASSVSESTITLKTNLIRYILIVIILLIIILIIWKLIKRKNKPSQKIKIKRHLLL